MVKATIPISYFHILNAVINLTQGLPKSQPEEEKENGKEKYRQGEELVGTTCIPICQNSI